MRDANRMANYRWSPPTPFLLGMYVYYRNCIIGSGGWRAIDGARPPHSSMGVCPIPS